jgi:hypothetical protein
LQRTILPGLLDGGSSRAVLQDFPDADLADALCMLLDLETAAPEVLSSALNHLDLSLERREAVVSLIDERLRARQGDQAPGSRDAGIDRYAQALITVNASASSNYSDFTAFDLSIDDHATAAVAMVRDGIYTTDVPATQFRCVRHIIHLEPNPTIVQGLLARAQGLFATFEQAGRWQDLARAVVECRQLADEFLERRPDVAEAITLGIAGLCTPSWVRALLDLSGRDADARATVNALIDALGPALVPGVIAVLDDPTQQGWSRALSTILCERAATLAPALEAALTSCGPGAAKTVVRALGHAGPGHEAAVAALIGHRDEQLAREALRALARIATPAAAALVADHIRATSLEDGGAAEEALWHFPAEQTAEQVCRLMLSQDFVVKHPAKVARLLDRASHSGARGLDEGLAALERLWTRFWNPSLVRLALKARELRAR